MTVKRFLTIYLVVVGLLLAACGSASPDPAELVQDLASALNAGDVDAAMALMADNPTFTSDETRTGADAVRELYAQLVANDFRIEPTVQTVDDNTVTTDTLTWGGGMPPAVEPLEATEIYVIEDGKISSITWTPTAASQEKLAAAMAAAEEAARSFTITIDGDACTYDGPEALPIGVSLNATLAVAEGNSGDKGDYAFTVLTLNEDKTSADLQAWEEDRMPPWANMHGLVENVAPGEQKTGTIWLYENTPAYLLCDVNGSSVMLEPVAVYEPEP